MGLFNNDKIDNQEDLTPIEENDIEMKKHFVIQSSSNAGEIQITANAIASIIRKEVLAIEDVTRFAPSGLVDGIADVFSNRNYERSIDIDFNEGTIDISLVLILRFGCSIRPVVNTIQDNVKKALETLADVKVGKINILVKDLEEVTPMENEDQKPNDDER